MPFHRNGPPHRPIRVIKREMHLMHISRPYQTVGFGESIPTELTSWWYWRISASVLWTKKKREFYVYLVRFPSFPLGDVLLHAGGMSRFGTFAEIQAQISWLASQPHQHKVIIAGNHDLLLDKEVVAAHPD